MIALEGRTTKPEAAGTTAATRKAGGLVTVRPKPEKRKNFKERAKAKYAKKTEDGTTPMTAKAKSKVDKKADAKVKRSDKKSKAGAKAA